MLRNGTIEDLPELIALGSIMFEESHFSAYDFDDLKTYQLLERLVLDEEGIVLVYETAEYGIMGAFVGGVTEHFFGTCRMSYDYGLFVLPEFRSTRAGYTLLKGYIQAAKDLKVDEIGIANTTGVESERVEALFTRFGFTRMGGTFTMKGGF